MNVRVGPGEAHIQGFQYKNDANVDLPIGANSSGSTRIDRVVLSLNRAANTLVLAVVAGTPGAGAPALTQVAGGNWQFLIADITVVNAASSITGGNISDQRVYSRWPYPALPQDISTDAETTAAVAGEATARAAAVTAEATARTNADNTEATNRANADTALGNRATALETVQARVIVALTAAGGIYFSKGNISSVTKIATGAYRINFAVAYPSATSYAPFATAWNSAIIGYPVDRQTTYVTMQFRNIGNTDVDCDNYIIIF